MRYTKIKSMDQYNEYCERHEELTFKDYESNIEEIELIEILIDDFDNRTMAPAKAMNPVELVSYLIQENNITKAQLAKELKVSRQLITDILNYRRNISKVMVNKFSERFRLNASAFSTSYQLNTTKPKKVNQPA